MTKEIEELIERLGRTALCADWGKLENGPIEVFVNPDGPEAAALISQILSDAEALAEAVRGSLKHLQSVIAAYEMSGTPVGNVDGIREQISQAQSLLESLNSDG